MPLTVEEYLVLDPMCSRLRTELEEIRKRAAGRPTGAIAARAEGRLAGAEVEARRMWELGLAGWMTAAEAAVIASSFNTDAEAAGLPARATVERHCGHVVLQFSGGREGVQRLALGTTSPVRARRHWTGYLTTCKREVSDAT